MSEVFWIEGFDWIEGNGTVPVAIVLRPQGGDNLEDELLRMKRQGIQTVVSLLEQEETVSGQLTDEESLARRIGLGFLSYPIPDGQIPADSATFQKFIAELAVRLKDGEHIGIHCWGSKGRASLVTACTLVRLGWSASLALQAIEFARGISVPDREEQRQFILAYE